MTEALTKEWFELQDIRSRNFSQEEWIPVYGKLITQEGNGEEVGYSDEYALFSSVIVYNDKRKLYRKGLLWGEPPQIYPGTEENEMRRVMEAKSVFDSGKYFASDIFYGNTGEILGLKLIMIPSKDMDHMGEPVIHQDFILAYGLLRRGDNWILPDYYSESEERGKEVIRQAKTTEGHIIKIEVKTYLLRDYLAALDAALRLSYYISRAAILSVNPACWTKDIKESKADSIFEVRPYPNSGKGYGWIGELWGNEWIEKATDTKLRTDNKEENFQVHIQEDGVPKSVSLERSYSCMEHCDPINRLCFKPEVINVLLEKGAELNWYHRNSGRIHMPEGYDSVYFLINEMGYINAKCWDIDNLPDWQKRIWVDHNEVPQGDTERDRWGILPQYPDESRHFRRWSNPKEAPEVRLLNAVAGCGALFSVHPDEEKLIKNLHRFQALDEAGLRHLALDMNKYCIERLNKEALSARLAQLKKSALSKDEKNLGSLKLLEKLLGSLNPDLEKDAKGGLIILASLFGLYDLRSFGGVAHLGSHDEAKIADCYNRIGIDRNAPHIEQGAQMLENIAIAFEKIAEILGRGAAA